MASRIFVEQSAYSFLKHELRVAHANKRCDVVSTYDPSIADCAYLTGVLSAVERDVTIPGSFQWSQCWLKADELRSIGREPHSKPLPSLSLRASSICLNFLKGSNIRLPKESDDFASIEVALVRKGSQVLHDLVTLHPLAAHLLEHCRIFCVLCEVYGFPIPQLLAPGLLMRSPMVFHDA